MKNKYKFLSYFLGPKSENKDFLEELFLSIYRDYVYWRKNYYPGDKMLIESDLKRDRGFERNKDVLYESVDEMMAMLRRNFPFYNPRYLAHMLSDITIPSLVGYFAGALFNPNNVTPEAAPVTTHMEIEACNKILKMLEYTPAPVPSLDLDKKHEYIERLNEGYAWCHITPGGTISNIEALWLARNITYFPLLVREAAKKENLEILIKKEIKEGKKREIKEFDIKDKNISDRDLLLLLSPRDAINLMQDFINAIQKKYDNKIKQNEAYNKMWELIESSGTSISDLIHTYKPLLFVSGAHHYSIKKAADLLGIGRDSIVLVKSNSRFRINIKDLEQKIIDYSKSSNKIPLAVVAIIGTTEEGSVDQIDKIFKLRERLEKEYKISFWIHADAAWGGFIGSLFNLEEKDIRDKYVESFKRKIKRRNIYEIYKIINESKTTFSKLLHEFLESANNPELNKRKRSKDKYGRIYIAEFKKELKLRDHREFLKVFETIYGMSQEEGKNIVDYVSKYKEEDDDFAGLINEIEKKKEKVAERDRKMLESKQKASSNNIEDFFKKNRTSIIKRELGTLMKEELRIKIGLPGLENRVENDLKELKIFASITEEEKNKLRGELNALKKNESKIYNIKAEWLDKDVLNSFMNLHVADSITVDPHKMYYVQYPNGAVAFKDDRVRYFIWQDAPYITSAEIGTNQPPKHIEADESGTEKIRIDSFGPFILEGSRPGASACALWLSTKVLPLTIGGHGLIVRSSVLASRALYNSLVKGNEFLKTLIERFGEINQEFSTNPTITNLFNKYIKSLNFEFIPLACANSKNTLPEDTNIVIFTIKNKSSASIRNMNHLTELVYKEFTILEELGEREYSYSQPFFVSKTQFSEPEYSFDTLKNFFKIAGILRDKETGSKGREEEDVKGEYKKEKLTVIRMTVMNPYILPIEKFERQDIMGEFISKLISTVNTTLNNMPG